MMNWALRYSAVLALLDVPVGSRVLDVGSGDHGLVRYSADYRVVCTDLYSPVAPPRCGFVAADATRLPFANDAFEVVVCLDLLEHLPGPLRPVAISELCRVASQQVVVGFPEGRWARRADWAMEGIFVLARRPSPPWLTEHREHTPPRLVDVRTMIPSRWAVRSVVGNENVIVHDVVLAAEEWRRGARLLERFEERRAHRRGRSWTDLPPCYRKVLDLRPHGNELVTGEVAFRVGEVVDPRLR